MSSVLDPCIGMVYSVVCPSYVNLFFSLVTLQLPSNTTHTLVLLELVVVLPFPQ